MQKYDQEIERQDMKCRDMKRLRRLWWHLTDEMGFVLWAVAVLLGSCVLWLMIELTLSLLR